MAELTTLVNSPKQANPAKPSLGQSSADYLIAYLLNKGVSAKLIHSHTGLQVINKPQQESRISIIQYNALWQLVIQVSDDPAIGLKMGSDSDLSRMGIVGHVIFNSRNLEEGIEHYIHLFNLINEALIITLEKNSDTASIIFTHKYPDYYCIQDMERSLVQALYRTRSWLEVNAPVQSIHFTHKAPSYESTYRKIFSCPVLFNQHQCKLVFSRSYLDYQSKKSNPYVKQASLQFANQLMTKFNYQSLTEKVRSYIFTELEDNEPCIERISAKLNISKQTLYRKLKAEGTLFKNLVEMVRFDKAKQLLNQTSLTTSEIAFRLGFSELSAFSRAFKRWSGVSPKKFRLTLPV